MVTVKELTRRIDLLSPPLQVCDAVALTSDDEIERRAREILAGPCDHLPLVLVQRARCISEKRAGR